MRMKALFATGIIIETSCRSNAVLSYKLIEPNYGFKINLMSYCIPIIP